MTQANNHAIESSQINSSGVLQPAGGGTGLTVFPAPGTSGYLMTSNGTNWTSTAAPTSYSGYSGYSGATGTSGYSGGTGTNGTSGYSGYSGGTGSNGASGYSGYSGGTGTNGTSGYSGYSGASAGSILGTNNTWTGFNTFSNGTIQVGSSGGVYRQYRYDGTMSSDGSNFYAIINSSNIGSQTVTALNSSNYIARTGSSGNLNTDFQNTPAGTFRYQGDDSGLANSPGGSWWIYQNMRHSNGSNYWGTQIAWGWEDNSNRLATRNVSGGTFGGWVYYLNNSNYTSYVTILSGPAYTNGSDGWFRTTSQAGIYFSTYGRGVWPVDGVVSYGNACVYGGGLNGWQGWSVNTANNCILMSNTGTHGFYSPGNGIWQAQWDNSGNVTWNGNVTAYSDIRLKNNIREIDNPTARRDTLAKSAIKYERDGRTRIGYGAQYLREGGCGEFVHEAEDDAYKLATGTGTLSVDYGETAAVLAVASKMTDDKVASLEARIAQLEKIIEGLTK